ncbi:FtsK/SpoIIIE domain-containing protein [Terrabacter lapilli]|uniref:FtsK/SpoIIIE domain-containing protein n=1 Tax=Terrabacter lapilli TaxID=436231 RepID=UPI0031E455F7
MRHVTIDAATGTVFGDLRARLAVAAGVAASDDLHVDGRLVEDRDVVGEPPLLRGALLVAGARVQEDARSAVPPQGAGAVELRVVGGVQAGNLVVLGRGEHIIGRAASAQVRLEDPGVSRAHAVLTVSAEGLHLRDLEPTNSSRVEGSALPAQGGMITAGQHVRIGSTSFVVGPVDIRGGHHEVVDGEVLIHRPPRLRGARDEVTVAFPEAPRGPEHGRLPLLASLAPLVLSGVLAVVLSSPALLLFALMSPVLLLGQWWSDRRAGRSSHRRQLKSHAVQLAQARAELEKAADADASRRRSDHPDLAHVETLVSRRGSRLWERRPTDSDHLVLRVGTATQSAEVNTEGPADPRPLMDELPALVDVGRSGVVGVAGPRAHACSLAGALLVQLAAWHTPRTLSLHVLADTEDHGREWEWAAHLPHLADREDHTGRVFAGAASVVAHVASLRTLVESRRTAREGLGVIGERRAPDVVVLVDGPSALRTLPGVSELLREGPQSGVALICLDRDVVSLPPESRALLEIDATRLEVTIREDGRVLSGVVPDLPSPGSLEAVCRTMAPYVDATPQEGIGALDGRVSFVSLHRSTGNDPTSAASLASAWKRSEGRPVALLGLAVEGAVVVDLAADGPHALVGGTTGSGKSELLQTLVTGLAVSSPPDELAFVLVDYKGGSAFSECARLPHTVGLVTDLDAHLTSRALTSLDAEMKRRERLLAQAGARDLDGYRVAASVCRDLPPLARLVIVVDEFKALAEEFPDFVEGLVRVAALGRSLGLHLVLATQRPAGIVTADMRANIALRIALRVRDRADSDDVIDSADAATLDPRTPGRACLRTGDHTLRTVQTAYLGASLPSTVPGPSAIRVVARDLLAALPVEDSSGGVEDSTEGAPDSEEGDGDDTCREERIGGRGCTELHTVVQAARAAAEALDLRPAPQPWLPPLPSLLTASDLASATDRAAAEDAAADGDEGALLGLVDLPREQRQVPLRWRPERDGHLGLAGGPRSGRTTALITTALALAGRLSPDQLHLHVVQGVAGPAGVLAGLPHAGTVTDATEPGLTRRLLTRLLELVDGQVEGPRAVVVLVDGWESVEESLTATDHGTGIDDVHRLLRDGPSAGVWFVVAGGRAVLSGRLPGLLQRRLVLAMPDPLDLTLAGVAPDQAPTHLIPGRAIDLTTGNHVQLAVPGTDASTSATAVAVERAGSRPTPEPSCGTPHHRASDPGACHPGVADLGPSDSAARPSTPWRIKALPAHVVIDHRDRDDQEGDSDRLVLGVGGDEARPVGLTPALGHRRFLVAGPPRSGRSTTLTTLGERLVRQGRHVTALCARRSPLAAWAGARGVRVLAPDDATELIELRRGDPDLCVLVDDVEVVEGKPVEAALVETVRLVGETDGLVAVAAELARANSAFRGLVPEVARDGCGLVLGATIPADGDVLGARLDPAMARRPGRGHLVVDGQAVPVQVARLDLERPLPDLPATSSTPAMPAGPSRCQSHARPARGDQATLL